IMTRRFTLYAYFYLSVIYFYTSFFDNVRFWHKADRLNDRGASHKERSVTFTPGLPQQLSFFDSAQPRPQNVERKQGFCYAMANQ
ncbi:hypothetical protein, partial [Enterobacter roggenkampii]|uniref:hypothetical protein n=2 Tax=Enterobacter roggenkampii TaxID=1812935 RepID=UPI00195314D6